jgi:sugar lactone lactonase YvrE
MPSRVLVYFVAFALFAQSPGPVARAGRETQDKATAELRARIEASPMLPFKGEHFAAQPPAVGWESGAVSWVAVDSKGTIYEIQRGDKADPIVVLDRDGKVLRSWGNGDYKIPHSIRVDPAGNVWTVDAASSNVIEYSALGKKLMTITVGEQPDNGGAFDGTTDVAFGPNGRLFITDGYGNARVLEYTAEGKRVKQWGKAGTAPGEFNLPHAIQIDGQGILYVADRENGRIEKFDLNGNFLGAIAHLGRIYSFKLAGGALWASMGPFNRPPGSPGWVVKLDAQSGKILGHLDVPEERGGHSIELMPSGEPLITLGNELLWFKKQ